MTEIFTRGDYGSLLRKDNSQLVVEGNFRAWDTQDNRLVLFIATNSSVKEHGFSYELRSYLVLDAITLKRTKSTHVVGKTTLNKYYVLMGESND